MNGALSRSGAAIRPEFGLEQGITYLNHGAFGATPRPVLQAQTAWRDRMEAQPVDFLVRQLPDLLDAAIADLAGFVGARPADLVFAENATNAINAVLRSLALGPDDEVVCTSYAHPGSKNPLDHISARRGARVITVPLPYPVRDPHAIVEPVRGALTDRTRLVVLDHISSPTALRLPMEGDQGLVALCRERGVPVLVDGAHAPGQLALDLAGLGADYYVGNCHKWLFTPRGCAFLWAREELHGALHPAVISDGYVHGAKGGWADEFHWVGTRDPSAWLSLPAALHWVRALGPEAVRDHNRSLCEHAARRLLERFAQLDIDGPWHQGLPTPAELRCAMMTLPLPLACRPEPAAAEALNLELWQTYRVEVPIIVYGGRVWARISAQVYNTLEDYDRLAEAVLDLAARGWAEKG